MTKKWPSFIARDLGNTPEDDAEMDRRWEAYNNEMQVIIASGIAHQDDDGWWVETATGELIGPDPEIERSRTEEEMTQAKPFSGAFPEMVAWSKRSRDRIEAAVEAGAKAFHDAMREKRFLRWETSSEEYRGELRDLVRPAVVAALATVENEERQTGGDGELPTSPQAVRLFVWAQGRWEYGTIGASAAAASTWLIAAGISAISSKLVELCDGAGGLAPGVVYRRRGGSKARWQRWWAATA
jgi:hypothetical protein